MIYFIIRFFAIPVAMVAWLLYQGIYKRKKWNELQHDVVVVLIFCATWIFLAYLMFS